MIGRSCFGCLALAVLWVAPAESVDLEVGDILVAVPSGSQVVLVDPVTGAQTVVASGLPMVSPLDVAITPDRQILVADGDAFGGGGGVIRIDPSDGTQTTEAVGPFSDPSAIALESDGRSLVVDSTTGDVFRVPAGGGLATSIAAVGAPGSELGDPRSVVVRADGTILIADGDVPDLSHFGVVAIDPVTLAQTVESAVPPVPLSDPTLIMDLLVEPDDTLYLAWTGDGDPDTNLLVRLDPATGVPLLFPPFESGTQWNAIAREHTGDFVGTVPFDGVTRVDSTGTTTPLSFFFNAFGLAVVLPACSDGLDNDDDGDTDFPDDTGCVSINDDDEATNAVPAIPMLGTLVLGLLVASLGARRIRR